MHYRTLSRVLVISVMLGLLSGCLAWGTAPVTGFGYTNVRGPIATGPSEKEPTRVGRSTVKTLFGLFATGDASIQTAARNGGISEIHHVDYETQSIFGVVAEYTVVVYGN